MVGERTQRSKVDSRFWQMIPEVSTNPKVTVNLASCLKMIQKCSFLWPLASEDSPKNRRNLMMARNLPQANARKQSACLDGLLVENGGYRSCAIVLLNCIIDETGNGESRLVLLCWPSKWKNMSKPTWVAGQRRRRGREREGNKRWHWGQRDRRCQFLAWSEIMRIMFDRRMGC